MPILGLLFNNPFPPAVPDESETVRTILGISGLRSFGELPYSEGLPAAWPQFKEKSAGLLEINGLMQTMGVQGLA